MIKFKQFYSSYKDAGALHEELLLWSARNPHTKVLETTYYHHGSCIYLGVMYIGVEGA